MKWSKSASEEIFRKPRRETLFVACTYCLLNLGALTYLLNRMVLGLTSDYMFQGASWPA